MLRVYGFNKTKPTRKPGLTKKTRDNRRAFYKAYLDQTLEDQKNVIQTDESAVILGHQRGGYRIQRLKDKAFLKSYIRERWLSYSEFMFQGAFSYNKKGPIHCWKPETKKDKEHAQKIINEINEILEPIRREEWELNKRMERLGLRNKPGIKPTWIWNKDHGKLVREAKKGGIDWQRYQSQVLILKLIPFVKKCEKNRPGIVV